MREETRMSITTVRDDWLRLAVRPWRTIDLMSAALIGVTFGVAYWGWSTAYDSLLTPVANFTGSAVGLLGGPWLIAGVVGGLVVRRPGAAIYAELARGRRRGTHRQPLGLDHPDLRRPAGARRRGGARDLLVPALLLARRGARGRPRCPLRVPLRVEPVLGRHHRELQAGVRLASSCCPAPSSRGSVAGPWSARSPPPERSTPSQPGRRPPARRRSEP